MKTRLRKKSKFETKRRRKKEKVRWERKKRTVWDGAKLKCERTKSVGNRNGKIWYLKYKISEDVEKKLKKFNNYPIYN